MNPVESVQNSDDLNAATGTPADGTQASDAEVKQASTEPVPREDYDKVVKELEVVKSKQSDFTKANQRAVKAEKALDVLQTRYDTTSTRVDELEQEILAINEGKEEASKQTYTNLKKRLTEENRLLKEDRAALAKEQAEHSEALNMAAEIGIRELVKEVAETMKVDVKSLQDRVTDFKVTTREDIELHAKYVPAAAKPNATVPPVEPQPRSGVGKGGPPEDESLKQRYPTMFK